MLTVHRHAEPIGSLLTSHRLDPLCHCPHVVAASHGRERAEQQSQRQSQVFVERIAAFPGRPRVRPSLMPALRESLQNAMLDQLKVATAKPRDPAAPTSPAGWRSRAFARLRIRYPLVHTGEHATRTAGRSPASRSELFSPAVPSTPSPPPSPTHTRRRSRTGQAFLSIFPVHRLASANPLQRPTRNPPPGSLKRRRAVAAQETP